MENLECEIKKVKIEADRLLLSNVVFHMNSNLRSCEKLDVDTKIDPILDSIIS